MGKSSGFSYGWVVVGVGALMTCVGFGSMLSLAVFLQPISEAMGWSRSGVSAAATIDFLCHGTSRVFLGRAVRPLRHTHRRAVGQRCCLAPDWLRRARPPACGNSSWHSAC